MPSPKLDSDYIANALKARGAISRKIYEDRRAERLTRCGCEEVEKITCGGVTTYMPTIDIESVKKKKVEAKEHEQKERERLDAVEFAAKVKAREDFDMSVARQAGMVIERLTKQDRVEITLESVEFAEAVASMLRTMDVSIQANVEVSKRFRVGSIEELKSGWILLAWALFCFVAWVSLLLVFVSITWAGITAISVFFGLPGSGFLLLAFSSVVDGLKYDREVKLSVTGL
jgi:hypothetical protein